MNEMVFLSTIGAILAFICVTGVVGYWLARRLDAKYELKRR